MPSIGETLREARVRQEIDIAEVESATKIRAKYLRALENEEFDHLPGSTFVRTFLRTYAEFLGLDPHLLVEEYRLRHEPAHDDEVRHLAPPPQTRRRRRDGGYRGGGGSSGGGNSGGRGASTARLVVGAVLAVILLLLVIGLVTGGGEDAGETGAPVATDAGDGRAARGDRQGGGQGDRQGGRERQRSGSSRPVALRVTPLDATYVCVDDGQGEPFEGVLESPRTFRAETLRLNLGRTSAELELDGKPVRLEESSDPVGFEFTSGGERELPVDQRPCT